MTYAFGDFTVTTWGKNKWRARNSETFAEFDASRDADIVGLIRLGRKALKQKEKVFGQCVEPNRQG